MVLATLGFDFNIHHPYKPLVAAIKKFKVAKSALAQVAWNFVNDGYAFKSAHGVRHFRVILDNNQLTWIFVQRCCVNTLEGV